MLMNTAETAEVVSLATRALLYIRRERPSNSLYCTNPGFRAQNEVILTFIDSLDCRSDQVSPFQSSLRFECRLLPGPRP
ncbi:hypothetical protein GQ600_13561 [Phytophthora cactorum]|nr:hypothetical protein GQ600_13561 [Phytophthora cactorum]